MKIHEYQGKQILADHDVAVPGGTVAQTVDEATEAAENLKSDGTTLFVVKAQIHAGGRGKGHTKTVTSAGLFSVKRLMKFVTQQSRC